MASLVDSLLHDPIFSKCNYGVLSRLLPFLEERSYSAGEVIYRAGDAADGLFLLTSGMAQLQNQDGQIHALSCPRFGEESATDADNYLTDAIALTASTVLHIPRDSLRPLLAAQPALKTEFLFALMSHMTGNNLQARKPSLAQPKSSLHISRLIGWVTAITLPFVVWLLGTRHSLDPDSTMFLAIFSSTVTMWAFSLVDDYVPGLFAVMAILIAGLVPAPIVLAGFSSSGYLMAMSILGLGTVIVASGLSYRTMLLLLRHLPNTRFWHNLGLTAVGLFLTPLIPSSNGRVTLITQFYIDMVQNLRFTHQRAAATQLVVSAFSGVTLLSAMFLSSKTVNFAVLSLLPAQTQDQFQNFNWLAAAGMSALVVLGGYAVFTILMFRSKEKPQICKERISAQLELLGTMKHREWAALLGIVVFIAGMLTASYTHIQMPWLGLAILYGLLLFSSLNKKELKEKIDWPFLLYLSGLTGIVSAFNYLGIDQLLAASLPGLGATMRDNFYLFVLMLFGLIFIIRLAVPISATIVILATVFMPLAEINGVNPWVVGFIILLLGEIWFLPYQCSYYLQLQEANRSTPIFHEKSFLIYNGVMNFVRLAAVYASLPYWKAIGLL